MRRDTYSPVLFASKCQYRHEFLICEKGPLYTAVRGRRLLDYSWTEQS